MNSLFYISGIVGIVSAFMVVTRMNAMNALMYLTLVFLSIAAALFSLGGPFAAMMEIVVYAGSIMVLFVFAIMLLNLGKSGEAEEQDLMPRGIWVVPALLAAALLSQFIIALMQPGPAQVNMSIGPKAVGISMFTDYVAGVELSSLLLLAALIAAFYFGIRTDAQGGDHE